MRSHDPAQQARAVLERFSLQDAVAALERCSRCNGWITLVDKAQVANRLPALTRLYYSDFAVCQGCGQVYWKGAHYSRIQQLLDRVTL